MNTCSCIANPPTYLSRLVVQGSDGLHRAQSCGWAPAALSRRLGPAGAPQVTLTDAACAGAWIEGGEAVTNGEARFPSGHEPADAPSAPIGRVLGTEDSTPLSWHVALNEDAYLQLDDVVVTSREVPGFGTVTIAGVVTEVTARHEGASFGSDVFLISDGVLPARVQETAEITTTRVEPECYVPPRPGEPASRAPAPTGSTRCTSTRWIASCRSAPAGTAPRSTSTSTSWTAPGARTFRS